VDDHLQKPDGITQAGGTPRPGMLPPAPAHPGQSAFPFLKPAQEADEIGRLGDYRVRRLLGKGGMAYVFHAEDLTLGRAVALKVMKPDLTADADAGPRFLREARLMAAIKHDHLVTVYQVGLEGSAVFLAMELLEGESLADWLEHTPRPPLADILRIGQELVGGLAVIHRNGMIHRDLKPANIWLEGPARRVKILDFGLARSVTEDINLTQTGMVMGTPAFMSPEQARGERVDARSDLFSIGSILFLMCAGRKPFPAETTMAVLTALAVDHPPPVHEVNPAIPKPVSELVAQLLAKRPEQRPASADEVLGRLRDLAGWYGPTSKDPSSRTQRLGQFDAAGKGSGQPWAVIGLAFTLSVIGAFVLFRLFGGSSAAALPSATAPPTAPVPTRAAAPPTQPAPVPGNPIYVADLKEVSASGWPMAGPLPPLPPDMLDPDSRNRIKVRSRGKFSPHGIFMHAPGGPFAMPGTVVSITYKLDRAYRTFQTGVTLNEGPPSCEPMEFAVYGDGRPLWRSKPVGSPDDEQEATVPVAGVDQLRIEVKFQTPKGAHAAWIEPRLLK